MQIYSNAKPNLYDFDFSAAKACLLQLKKLMNKYFAYIERIAKFQKKFVL